MHIFPPSGLVLLGDPRLYQICDPVEKEEMPMLPGWKSLLHSLMEEIRERYHFGRAIAAPQAGIMKRLVYLHIDTPMLLINPVLSNPSEEMITLWDDCMSFPELLVRVMRHRSIHLQFLDEHWQKQEWHLTDDLSELLQHECDHLDGILATMRAIDSKSFRWKTISSSKEL